MGITVGTFNVENLFMRYRLLDAEKGGRSPRKVDPEKFIAEGGYIGVLGCKLEDFGLVSTTQRKVTGKVIIENAPDVVALQEVENMKALEQFNSRYLKGAYDHFFLVEGNDPRGIDVAILSKFPIVHARSYREDTFQGGGAREEKVFSRDCLEVDVVAGKKTLTLYVNHFKSKIGGGEEKRLAQATRVAEIVRERFGARMDKGDFVIVGDFNCGPDEAALEPLLGKGLLENVIQTRIDDPGERWTHYYPKGKEALQLDYILLSPTMSKKTKGVPVIERRGLNDTITPYQGKRFTGVSGEGTEASDHCGVFMKLAF